MKETESNKSSRDADKAKGSGRLAPSSLSMASIHDNEAMETRKTGHFTRGDDMDSVHAAARESSSFNQKRQTNENELELTKLLKFKSLDIETEFLEYFARENLRRWKKTNHLMFFVVSLLYVYLLARNNADSITYEEKYNPSLRVEESICPTGWFCSVCDPSIICTTYQPTYDASLWFVAVLVPYVAGQGVSYYCKPNLFAKYVDKISMAIIIAQQFIGIGIRYHIVDAGQTFLEPTILMNSIISFSFVGLNASFRHALPTLALIFISWVVLTTIAENHALVPHTERSRLLGLVTMFITFSVLSYGSYESERFYRLQFLTSKDMKKNNAKLKNQLNQLAKSYNQKASKNLESPLERSMLLIRSVMADPTLSSRQLMALGQVTTLLGSSNLLTPDIETNMDETMDNDTQAWLFSEIAARRRKGRSKSIQFRRRVSMGPRELPILESITNEMSSSNGLSTDNRVVSFSNCQEQSAISGYSDNRAAYPPEILEIANILERYNDYDFNLFNLSNATGNRSLYILSHHLFAQANLFEAYNIPRDKFSNCIAAIEQGYHADLPCNVY
ncbi:hypothetical protein BC833DRAFT_298810 [Globomyces pollinis-pini]|nr:hypothetical protein BC833DRAFT_298810 [Globomyces pollinis-pini]